MNINTSLNTAYTIYKLYEDILNSYVSDYYIEEHWKKLPSAWQRNLEDITMDQLSDLLDFTKSPDKIVYSLSLLCLRKLITCHAVSRLQIDVSSYNCPFGDNDSFMKFFWKNVKLKKRHEINIMAKLCNYLSSQTNCCYIVDVGSGLGHLSRMLSFGYGLKVLALEAEPTLVETAKEMDKAFENTLNNKQIFHKKVFNTVHINKKINHELSSKLFLNLVRNAFNVHEDNFKFGLIGLHPCGNLSSALLTLYSNSPNIAFIAMASCCYMKLTINPSLKTGFPISTYSNNHSFKLSYLACEIACHAIENYIDKLKHPEDYRKLKIHSYRAILEMILVTAKPDLKHSMVCSVKYTDNLTFESYCQKTLDKYNLFVPENIPLSYYENLINNTWKKVVAFYSIRLLLAPLVETIILLDRLLYLHESNNSCQILAAFDCKISPRNQVLIATKNNDNIEKYKQ